MTDKQMEEKKKEFFERFTESHDGGIEAGEYYLWKSNDSAGELWQWIERLVEEVEDSLVQEFEDCISEELLIDVEKFSDLKDTVESKWD